MEEIPYAATATSEPEYTLVMVIAKPDDHAPRHRASRRSSSNR